MPDIGEPALGALEPFPGARRILTRRAHGFERGAGSAVGLGERILGDRQAVGRGAAPRFRAVDLGDQRHALLGKDLRRPGELVALGAGFAAARLERRDLRGRAVAARLPFVALGGDRLQTPIAELGLAGERLRFRADFGDARAMALDLVAQSAPARLRGRRPASCR